MPIATAPMKACPSCEGALRSSLLCEDCGVLLPQTTAPTPFEAFGLAPAFLLEPSALKKRLLELSRALHPDFHSAGDERQRQNAQENTAALNSAFHVLSNDGRRADWLVQALGGPGENEERSMPGEFLQEVMEWNEAIDEARSSEAGSPASEALVPLSEELQRQRTQAMEDIRALLTPLPPEKSPLLRQVRQRLNAARYLDRALAEIGELRLHSSP